MSRAETHITLHGEPPTEQIKVNDSVAIVTLTSPSGEVVQTLSGTNTRVVDELLSLAGRVAREIDWGSADPLYRANVQRNAASLASRVTVEDTAGLDRLAEAVKGERWPSVAEVAGEVHGGVSCGYSGCTPADPCGACQTLAGAQGAGTQGGER